MNDEAHGVAEPRPKKLSTTKNTKDTKKSKSFKTELLRYATAGEVVSVPVHVDHGQGGHEGNA